jgi:hypothetical protein
MMKIYLVWADCGRFEGYSWIVKGFTDHRKAEQFAEDAMQWLTERNLLWVDVSDGYIELYSQWVNNYKERLAVLKTNPFDPAHATDLSHAHADGLWYSVKDVEVEQ